MRTQYKMDLCAFVLLYYSTQTLCIYVICSIKSIQQPNSDIHVTVSFYSIMQALQMVQHCTQGLLVFSLLSIELQLPCRRVILLTTKITSIEYYGG